MIDTKELRQSLGTVTPEEIDELLDRLEAAEISTQDYLRIDGEKALLAQRLEAAEKERDELRSELTELRYGAAVAHDTIKALRAKIAEMEQQEPVAEWVDGAFDQYPHLRWKEPYKAIVGAKLYTTLYALPGAKGE